MGQFDWKFYSALLLKYMYKCKTERWRERWNVCVKHFVPVDYYKVQPWKCRSDLYAYQIKLQTDGQTVGLKTLGSILRSLQRKMGVGCQNLVNSGKRLPDKDYFIEKVY